MNEIEIIANIFSELNPNALTRALEYRLTTLQSIKQFIFNFDNEKLDYDDVNINILATIKKYVPAYFINSNSINFIKNNDILNNQYISNNSSVMLNPLLNFNSFESSKILYLKEIYNNLINGLNTDTLNIINELNYNNIYKLISIDLKLIKKSYTLNNDISQELLLLKSRSLDAWKRYKFKYNTISFDLPDQSILKAPVLLLFGYDILEYNNISDKTLSNIFNISSDCWHIFNRMNLFFEDDSVSILNSITINSILQRDLPKKLEEVFINNKNNKNIDKYFNNTYFLSQKYLIYGNIPISFLIDCKYSRTLEINGYSTIKDLCNNSEFSIFNMKGFCFNTLKIIYAFYYCSEIIKKYFSDNIDDLSLKFNNYEELFDNYIICIGYTLRESNIFKARLYLTDKYGQTLDEIGKYFNITKERVRQIEQKIIKKIILTGSKYLNTFKLLLENYAINNGIFSVFDVNKFIFSCLGLDATSHEIFYEYLYNILFHYKVDKENNIIIYPNCKCKECHLVNNYIYDNIIIENSEININDLEKELLYICKNNKCKNYLKTSAIKYILNQYKDISIYNDIIYNNKKWDAPRGTLIQIIEEIVLNQKKAIHYTKIIELLKENYKEYNSISERALVGSIIRNDNLLLWGRGSFIHRKNIVYNKYLLEKIELWIKNELNNLQLIYVGKPFKNFYEDCQKNGIISELALYTSLRELNSRYIVLPKYPQIYSIKNYTKRKTANEIIEEYILQFGGPVSKITLQEYCINKIGMKIYQYNNILSTTNEILRYSENEYIHIDNLKIHEIYYNEIFNLIASLIQKHKHISIIKIFNKKRITCLKMGIKSPYLLYELLYRENNSEFLFNNYPEIIINDGQTDFNSSIINKIVLYIKEKGTYCTLAELEDEYVGKLGYNARTVKSIIYSKYIYKYTNSSLIHEETLGINNVLSEVEQIALNIIEKNKEYGINIGNIDDVLEEGLPKLKCDLPWTSTLIRSILEKSNKIVFIGNAKHVISLNTNNKENYLNTIVTYIIDKNFHGAADINELEKVLVEKKLIIKSFSTNMLPFDTNICIKKNTVYLKGIDLYA